MKVKKLLILLFIAELILIQSNSVYAKAPIHLVPMTEQDDLISPQWTNVNDININLYFENGEANCSVKIRALSGTTNIAATFKLERKTSSGWELEKTWNMSTNSNTLSFFERYAVSSGYTYRLSVAANVTRDGVIETVKASTEGYY